jgi:FixJ family two-component response regulator
MKTCENTLFVVDDDPVSRKAVAALASSMRIRCETFASAEGFLDRYDPSLTGCALVDYRLGGMDGLELQDRLRALGSALGVVLISACVDSSLAVRALNNGAVAFVEKPYRDDELADAVQKAFDRSVQLRQSQAQPPQYAAQGHTETMLSHVPKSV